MATIKINTSGNVILKNGLVSCTCCEFPPTDCCMYPAMQVFDGSIPASDLPDIIKIYNGGLVLNGDIANKSGSNYYLDRGDGYIISAKFYLGNYEWRITDAFNNEDLGLLNAEVPSCLIAIWPVEGDAAEDDFANSYNVYNNSLGLNVGTADRLDVCTWGIPDIESGYKLFIKYNSSGSNAFKWTIETAGNIFVKAAPQKSPVGNYDFMGITIYTVS